MRTAELGDVCEFKPSKRLARNGLSENDPVSFVPMNDLGIHRKYLTAGDERPLSEVAGSYTYFGEGDVLLAKITPCFENGKLGIARGLTNGIGFGSSEFTVIRPGPDVLAEYVYYFLDRNEVRERGAKVMTGAVGHKRVPQEFVETLEIPLPPLEEQRRIVAVLDEAFGAIATATTNAEKNLANAEELLHAGAVARLRAQQRGWIEKSLGAFCDIYQPETISKKQMSEDGQYPVFGANGEIGHYNRYNHEEPQLLLTCRGATCGSINMSKPFSWITGNAMVVRPRNGELRLGLLKRIFETGFDFGSVITGAAQPQITRQSLAPSKIAFPLDSDEQGRLEVELDEIETQTNALTECYEGQITELAELKQSLLSKAFSGELTDREPLAA